MDGGSLPRRAPSAYLTSIPFLIRCHADSGQCGGPGLTSYLPPQPPPDIARGLVEFHSDFAHLPSIGLVRDPVALGIDLSEGLFSRTVELELEDENAFRGPHHRIRTAQGAVPIVSGVTTPISSTSSNDDVWSSTGS